jgi:hypothetical protein
MLAEIIADPFTAVLGRGRGLGLGSRTAEENALVFMCGGCEFSLSVLFAALIGFVSVARPDRSWRRLS